MDEKTKKRCDELVSLDMKFSFQDGGTYIGTSELNSDFNVHHTEITCDTDEEWDKKIEGLKKELKRRKDGI